MEEGEKVDGEPPPSELWVVGGATSTIYMTTSLCLGGPVFTPAGPLPRKWENMDLNCSK